MACVLSLTWYQAADSAVHHSDGSLATTLRPTPAALCRAGTRRTVTPCLSAPIAPYHAMWCLRVEPWNNVWVCQDLGCPNKTHVGRNRGISQPRRCRRQPLPNRTRRVVIWDRLGQKCQHIIYRSGCTYLDEERGRENHEQ